MTDEPVTTLGRSLQAGYQDWLVRFVPSWPDEFRLAVHDWETLSQVDAEFARLLRYIQECLELDAWLGSGFFPMPAGDAVFDPTAAGGSPGVHSTRIEADPVTAAPSPAPPSRTGVFKPSRAEPWPSPGADYRGTAPHRTIPLPADNANTAVISGSESPVLPATTGSGSGLSGGSLRDLVRRLQITPPSEAGVGSDDNSLTDPSSFSAETAWPEPARAAESAWPALTDATLPADAWLRPSPFAAPMSESAEADSGFRIVQTVSVQAKPSVPTRDPAPTAVATPDNRERPDPASFTAEDLRRLGQELSVDDADFPAIDTASLPPAAASAPVVDWRKLLLILPLRREVSIAPQATPGSAGVPAGMTVGDDDLYEIMPEVAQRNIATAVTAAPNNPAAALPDLHDLLKALSQEIWREYQRFYGSG